jgi:hypothetical protein
MSDDDMFRYNVIEGKNKFNSMRGRAFWKEVLSLLRGKPVELLSFDDIKQRLRLREESYRGLQDVPLDQIAGSVGRYREFTRDFLPRRHQLKERWSRVYAKANSQTGLPPIELYKIGEVYFVRDGNHRVSVARQMGVPSIQAHVTELPTSVDISPDMDATQLEDATAYAAFLAESRLEKMRPHHQPLKLSERTRYSELMGHIYLHKSILEFMADREMTFDEAAIHWYDNVYRPVVTLIRKYDMMRTLPDRTEADLYLWVVDHLRDLRRQFGDNAPRKISDALADFLRERDMEVPNELIEEDDETVILTQTQVMQTIQEIAEDDTEDTPEPSPADDDDPSDA